MTGPRRDEAPTSGNQPDELDLDKQTIQDLDVNEPDADAVAGGVVGKTGTKPPTTE
jgi:hypothetical protein